MDARGVRGLRALRQFDADVRSAQKVERVGDGVRIDIGGVAVTYRLADGDLVRTLGRLIGGGGGGRPDMAEAGGKDPGRLDEALERAAGEVERCLEGD